MARVGNGGSRVVAVLAQRGRLPAHQFRQKVIDAVNTHQVVVVSGETGCGKTTQVSLATTGGGARTAQQRTPCVTVMPSSRLSAPPPRGPRCRQVPQFLLENAVSAGRGGSFRLVCTQPRRISAVGVAERVAAERGERIGQSVGYTIKGEGRSSEHTRLEFCTVGILLRRLQVIVPSRSYSLEGGGRCAESWRRAVQAMHS